ncbi:MAG TPA: tRNA (N6-isopentenyl adenosine(37)-C2)-methylthiotransferase MiaB, partial [Dietzia sp.]|nr:tRNA (N6-isopentenyl adenosine(37)-C2)-methylthiotransferase MiaB [Dietzia sp.]
MTDPQTVDADARVEGVGVRTYQVRTFGCQMNVHDSERLSGVLDAAGYVPFEGEADPAEGSLPD